MYIFNRVTVVPQLPDNLKKLSEIANNLWWSWNTEFLRLFETMDNDLWESVGKNPVKFLNPPFLRIFKSESLQIDIVPVNERAGTKIYERVKMLVKYFETHYTDITFNSVILAHRSFRNDVETLIKNHKIKLLVVPNKKKNIFARLFNPSIAHKMLFERDIPMLVLPV